MVFSQDGIEKIIWDHFKERFDGHGSAADVREVPEPTDPEVSQFEEDKFEDYVCSLYSFSELEEMLDHLSSNKAAGTDNISNELLKNTNLVSRLYIQAFVNQILAEGEVPEELNNGKCVLIYKVDYKIYKKY